MTLGSGAGARNVCRHSNDAKDALSWQWEQGDATDVAAFGDLVNGTTDYAFCLYETTNLIAQNPRVRVFNNAV